MKRFAELWTKYGDVVKVVVAAFLVATLSYCVATRAEASGNRHEHQHKTKLKSDDSKFWKGIVLSGVLVGVACHLSEGCRFSSNDAEKKEEPKDIQLRDPNK